MYSRYDPTAYGTLTHVEDAPVELPEKQPEHPTAPAAQPSLLDGLRGLLGERKLDLGDLLLLAIIALLVLDSGDETDLIILLAVALIVGF